MGRNRIHASAAERQRAYRERLTRQAEPVPSPSPRRPRLPSRPARLLTAIDLVFTLQTEYEAWRERLPESLADSEQAARLDETVDLLQQAADLLDAIDPPRGFGRD